MPHVSKREPTKSLQRLSRPTTSVRPMRGKPPTLNKNQMRGKRLRTKHLHRNPKRDLVPNQRNRFRRRETQPRPAIRPLKQTRKLPLPRGMRGPIQILKFLTLRLRKSRSRYPSLNLSRQNKTNRVHIRLRPPHPRPPNRKRQRRPRNLRRELLGRPPRLALRTNRMPHPRQPR